MRKISTKTIILLFLFFLVDTFLEIIHRGNLEPTKKFKSPQTTAQEIGWLTTPLVKIKKKNVYKDENIKKFYFIDGIK